MPWNGDVHWLTRAQAQALTLHSDGQFHTESGYSISVPQASLGDFSVPFCGFLQDEDFKVFTHVWRYNFDRNIYAPQKIFSHV